MAQWYFAYGDQRVGPMETVEAVAQASANPNGFAWREGLTDWLPIRQVLELRSSAGAAVSPPPLVNRRSDEIDYKIMGAEMQFVEVELDPGESAVAEAGAMMYKDASIQMSTVFGDGSATSAAGSLVDKLVGAGKRLLTGAGMFMTVFTHTGNGKGHVAFAAPYPGNITPLRLTDFGGRLICQKDSFLCAAKGVSIGIFFQKKFLTGLFGGEGFIMQKLEGDGWVFIHMGGTAMERELAAGEVLHVDTGCIVAFQDSVAFDIQQVGGIQSMLFGGEGVFFATLQGPGRIWLQSLPFSRLAGRMLQAAPQRGGSREEGSVLGPLGGLLRGDNSF